MLFASKCRIVCNNIIEQVSYTYVIFFICCAYIYY